MFFANKKLQISLKFNGKVKLHFLFQHKSNLILKLHYRLNTTDNCKISHFNILLTIDPELNLNLINN